MSASGSVSKGPCTIHNFSEQRRQGNHRLPVAWGGHTAGWPQDSAYIMSWILDAYMSIAVDGLHDGWLRDCT